MPQMSPMNWMFLFLFFNFILYISFCMISFLAKIMVTCKKNLIQKNPNVYLYWL